MKIAYYTIYSLFLVNHHAGSAMRAASNVCLLIALKVPLMLASLTAQPYAHELIRYVCIFKQDVFVNYLKLQEYCSLETFLMRIFQGVDSAKIT